MHMSDALVSAAVGGTMAAVTLGTMGYSIKKIKLDFDEKKLPLMGVMGAFVFAGQMINFTIPGTGSSGHIGGAILLAAVLGQYPAFLTLAAVLLIQALFFADGGLLAYGCNVFNMGFFACFLAYPLIFKPILKRGITKKNITVASILSVVVGLQFGAFAVVVETLASGVTELPFGAFAALMQPIHLAIGIVEGLITASVLCFVHEVKPEILRTTVEEENIQKDISLKKIIVMLGIATLLIGGGISLFASSNPDGLEWSMEGVAGTTELEQGGLLHDGVGKIQELLAFLPDYGFKDSEGSTGGTMVSGLVGSGITLLLCIALGVIVVKRKKEQVNMQE